MTDAGAGKGANGTSGGSGGSLDLAVAWLTRSIADMAANMPGPRPARAPHSPAAPSTDGDRAAPSAVSTPSAASAASAPGPTGARAEAPGAGGPAVTSNGSAAEAVERPTPLLDQLGRDLTALAGNGELPPSIGRDTEIARLIEALCRPTRASAVLLGPEGIGKASIVEGLAERIATGEVPAPLRDVRIIEVPATALVAGTQYRGQLEERVRQLVDEASQPGVILFFDGLAPLARAGRTDGGPGLLEAIHPALARGAIRVVGTAEADAFRSMDEEAGTGALFTAIPVAELDRDATRPVLAAVRDRLAETTGVTVTDAALDVLLAFADAKIGNRRFPDKAVDLLSEAIAAAIVAGRTTVEIAEAAAVTVAWTMRASSTPTLERLGRDLVALARDGKLGPIVGREREVDALIGVLLRRTKRNPALVGPAGSGKTAIVEGLAIRIAEGKVPAALVDAHVFDVPLLALAAAAETSRRVVEDLLTEARHPSVVLFFDEMHVLALPAVHDLAERLKPPLARGEIAVIGATTSEEYQQLVEPLSALARRFTIVPVEPMDAAAVRDVLVRVGQSLTRARGVTITDAALDELIDLADRFLPNRAQPDKGVDLLEQAVTWALTHDRSEVDPELSRDAVAALVGMPPDPAGPLATLDGLIRDGGLLDDPGAAALITRLGVALRGLDARREQPDAVLLLCGAAASGVDALADSIAASLFGRAGARIDIDLSGMTEDASISSLLGSSPGLVGSERTLPLHALRRTPWQVVVLRGIDRCAISIRDTISAALQAGRFSDAMGRGVPLGAAVVVLTAPSLDGDGSRPPLATVLGRELVDACDVIAGEEIRSTRSRESWALRTLLEPLAERITRSGYPATVAPALAAWVAVNAPDDAGQTLRWLDSSVTGALLASLPAERCPVRLDAGPDGPMAVAADEPRPSPGAVPGT
jgi:ATP-dependent Clp protease ATP-binding subunit ClpC